MRIRIDARLRTEAARLDFRFACEDCVHFAPQEARCSLGYPPEPRRGALALATVADPAEAEAYLATCKDFDLV